MSEYLVCEGCTLKFLTPGVSGTISITGTSILSQKVKCSGNKVYKAVGFAITGATNGTVTAGTGTGIIQGGTTKVDGNVTPLVFETDKAIGVVVSGVIGSTPSTFTCDVGIDNPGQDRAKAV
jgi:hypothetical protein